MEKSEDDENHEQLVNDDSVTELQNTILKDFLKNQTAQNSYNVELLKDEALIKLLDENLPIKRIFSYVKQQYLLQFVKKELRPNIKIANPNFKQRQLERKIVIEN